MELLEGVFVLCLSDVVVENFRCYVMIECGGEFIGCVFGLCEVNSFFIFGVYGDEVYDDGGSVRV